MSETTIDTLVIDVSTNASNAVKGLQDLATALEGLKSAGKFSTVSKNLNNLASALERLRGAGNFSTISKNLSSLTSALESLKGAGKFSTVSKNLNNLSTALNNLSVTNDTTSKLTTLADSLSKLKDASKGNGLASLLKNIQKIPEVTKSLDAKVIKQFADYMSQLAAALEPLSTRINTVAAGFSKLPNKVTQCVTAVDKMNKSSNTLKSRLGGLGNTLQGFLGISLTGYALGGYFKNAISEINSFVERINYSNQVMGEYAEEAQNYAYKVQDVLGIDASSFIEAQSTFMSLAQGFGVAGDKAYAMSKGLTELAYDISSFKDEDPEEVFQRLQSAISGEIEPVRRWGVALDQASMKQWMLKNGIEENINSLTQADKALIRYNMTVETMAKNGAIYDLARTLQSPANAIRILKQQFTQLSRAIGSLFIPILVAVIPYVQAFVKVITTLVSALASLLGFEMPSWTSSDWEGVDSLSSGIEDTSNGLDDATDKAKEFKKQLMGFDELNIISKPSDSSSKKDGSSGAGGTSALDGLDVASVWDDGMLDGLSSKVDELVPKVKGLLTVVGLIGAGFLAWKLGSAIFEGFQLLQGSWLALKGFPSLATMMLPDKAGLFGALGEFGALIGGLSAPVGIAIAAVVLLVAAIVDLWKNSETFRNTVKGVWDEVCEAFKNAWNSIWTYGISPLLNAFGITANSIGELYSKYIRPVVEAIATFFVEAFGTTITVALNGFAGYFQTVTGIIKGLLTGDWSQAIDGVKNMFGALPTAVQKAFTNLINLAKEKLVEAKEKLTTAAGNVKSSVQTKFSEMKTYVVNKFGSLTTDAKAKLTTAKTTLSSAASAVKSSILTPFKAMRDTGGSYFEKLRDKGKNALNTLKTTIKSPINGIIGGVEKMANGIIKAINGMVKAFNKLSWDIPSWVPGGMGGKKFGFNLSTVSLVSIPRFEKGGFIEDGLFTMNRGEIAGKFNNGQSVVANNMQIISGIRAGVMEGIKSAISGDLHSIAKALTEANRVNYRVVGANTIAQTSTDSSQLTEAVYNAINESGDRGGTYTFVLDMDGEVVAKKVFKVHNDKVIQTGKTPLLI